MLSNQSKRLDKLEAKTRTQWETESARYWEELFGHFSRRERQEAEAALQKWFTSPLEHKVDETALQQHFSAAEVELLKRIDIVWATPRFATMREMIEALYFSLQACERIRA